MVPLPVYKVNGDLALANFRLAPIVNGKVWCLHYETLEPFECALTEATGCTLESERGLYTTVGQLISHDGEPGGCRIRRRSEVSHRTYRRMAAVPRKLPDLSN